MKLSDIMEKYGKIANVQDRVIRIGGQKVVIKAVLTAENFISVAYNMTMLCFEGEEKTTYRPEYREIARRYIIIKYFTDIDIDDMTIEEVFATSQRGTWFKEIEREVTSLSLWAEIENTVDKNIDYKIAIQRTSFDELCEILSDSVEKIIDTKEISKIADSLENIDDKQIVEAILNENHAEH